MLNGCFVNPSSATKLVGECRSRPRRAWRLSQETVLFTAAAPPRPAPLPLPPLRSVLPGGRPLPPPAFALPLPSFLLPVSPSPAMTAVDVACELSCCVVRVWQGLLSQEAANRLDGEGARLFMLLQMPGLCPEFLLSRLRCSSVILHSWAAASPPEAFLFDPQAQKSRRR